MRKITVVFLLAALLLSVAFADEMATVPPVEPIAEEEEEFDASEDGALGWDMAVADPTPGKLMADVPEEVTLSVGGLFAAGPTVLGSDIPRESITSICFESSLLDAPADAWDVSAEQNGSVLAWVTDGVLMIAGEGGVWANENCSHLFAGYSAAESINFNGSFFTDGVTDMSHMFESCWSLRALDVSGMNTASVADMSYMFSSCPELEELDVSGFDTGAATNMEAMFLLDAKLEAIDISNFEFGSVENMNSMFSGCEALANVEAGANFVAPAEAKDLFADCPAVLRVDGVELSAQMWEKMDQCVGLQRKSKGDAVRWLQNRLSELGYAIDSVDGVFGRNTEAALMQWQQDNDFEATGVTDRQQVWALLQDQ